MSEQEAFADAERPYLVAFQHVPYVGPVALARLRETFGSAEAAWTADGRYLRAAVHERAAASLESTRRSLDVNTICSGLERDGISVVTIDDAAYPRLLREIHQPPPVLFVRGTLVEDDAMAVAIVGTRQITPYGRTVTEAIASGLAQAGVTVVSGMAKGVDGVAHQAALDAGGRTIAVLGSGLRQIYPAEHRRLAERIAELGAVISDYPPDTKPDARNFPARNRIISGLSCGVVVTEAPEKSGALITVDFAADQGRDVCAVPGPVGASKSAGCNQLIRNGAFLVRSARDVLDDLGIGRTPEQLAVQQALPLGESERLLLGVMSGEPRHIDDLRELANLPTTEVSSVLMLLELQGLVTNAGAQHYVRSGR
ncbi:MAG: DNA-processing protein DprA [Thermomicrobiales bacterium]